MTPQKRTLVFLIGILSFMIALTCASVPLYRMFCQQTGYGGTPKIVTEANPRTEDRMFRIEFNADIDRDLPWEFIPSQPYVYVQAGVPALAFYKIRNKTSKPMVGIAAYNVTPDKAGQYFHKIACFCFNEQIIPPGEVFEMPVQFYIDADIVDNPDLNDLKRITLSYTFYKNSNFDWDSWQHYKGGISLINR